VNTVRTVADTKQAFYHIFSKPINSVYRRILDELMVELHLLSVNQTFAYDGIFALGAVTAFDRFMAGYHPVSDREPIFIALTQSLNLSLEKLRQDGNEINQLAERSPSEVLSLLTSLESTTDLAPLTAQIREIASKEKFKYSRFFGIGLFTLLEICQPDEVKDSSKRLELLTTVGNTTKIGDRFAKDIDLYLSNLEKVEQGRQMMADMAEAERKKREKAAKPVEPLIPEIDSSVTDTTVAKTPESGAEK
jgi:photosystem II biogenesis protein Psp29